MSKRRIAISLVVLSILTLSACVFPQQEPAEPGRLDGTYYVNGVDPEGKDYSGQLIITPTDRPNRYEMSWIITGAIQSGTGRLQGTTLEAEWSSIEGQPEAAGTATYQWQDDGSLIGERVVQGLGVATEEALPVTLR